MTRLGKVAVADLVIDNEADNKRAMATVEKLMCRDRTPDEDALLKVLTNAIEKYESKAFPALSSASKPAELIQSNKTASRRKTSGMFSAARATHRRF
jgi:antitoxin component HigA of HigAB toxin-antitoxin module